MLSRWKLSSEASIAPDNDVFKHLAEVYSFNHQTMHKGAPCPDGSVESFVNGTTNGAKWYPLPGKKKCNLFVINRKSYLNFACRWNARLQLRLWVVYGDYFRAELLQIPVSK